MDYKDIAKAVKRSPQTVRKWCPKITALSGYDFDFEIQRRRDGDRKIPKFTQADLTKFMALRQALALSNNFEQSVFKVYGNLKTKRERDLKEEIQQEIDDLFEWFSDDFSKLKDKITSLEQEKSQLVERISKLEQFNSRLEKIEIGLRKKTIKDLLI
ncbi:hypothetical protein FACS1894192_01360 [Bacilli bacterium]|nr:hypothetical protein FACS1894192_01360 [Bacilli bacterium]